MGSMLPWWLLVVPPILVVLDSMMSSKTSTMGGTNATGTTSAMVGRTDGTTPRTTAY